MAGYLPSDLLEAVHHAQDRGRKRGSRLAVHADGRVFPVRAATENTLVLGAQAQNLRGNVALFDGPKHLAECLIMRAEPDPDGVRYEIKRRNLPRNAPARDYASDIAAPVALIEQKSR